MTTVRRLLIASLVFGLISLCFFILGRLAMTDIFHGEPDLSLEWSLVSLSFFPVLIFHLLAVFSLVYALWAFKGQGSLHP